MASHASVSTTENTPQPFKGRYRPEIDGLRAFAVVAVIINHFNKDLLPSGYLGVDIFFVISGYVITSSLAGRQSKNFLVFVTGFYERRIKRLVPALVVFVLITSVLICLFDPDPDLELKTGGLSILGASNLYLHKQATDYFAQSAELNPFTHTWSLGVEEQFYLLFPFFIWFSGFGRQTAKGARNLFLLVGALTMSSLIGFIYLFQVDQPGAYFLMPPRFWEMAAGCLIFIGFHKRARIEQALEQVPPLLVVAAMVVVMLLPVAAAVPATIGVVVLSSVLIACLKHGTAAYKFFTLEKVLYIGLISYSLYLWHWTVLSISRWTIGIHWWSVPLQVAIIVSLASASHKWIEAPLRRDSGIGKAMTFISGGATIAATIAMILVLRFRVGSFIFLGSLEDSSSKQFDFTEKIKANADMSIILLGDSHAGHFQHSLRKISRRSGFYFSSYSDGATAFPVLRVSSAVGGLTREKNGLSVIKMDESANDMTESMGESSHKIVLLSSFYQFYFDQPIGSRKYMPLELFDSDGRRITQNEALNQWISAVRRFAFSNKDKKIVIVLSTPEIPGLLPEKICKLEIFRPWQHPNCTRSIPYQYVKNRFSRVNSEISSLTKLSNIKIFDPLPYLCDYRNNSCHSIVNGSRAYSDEDHLNEYGADVAIAALIGFIEKRIVQARN